jgi:hypothetical protein
MRECEIDNRGNVAVVLALLSLSLVLYISAIVIGKLANLNGSLSGCTNTASTTAANYQVFVQLQNMTSLATQSMSIASIGVLILAVVGILSYFGIGFGGGRSGRK